MTTPQQKLTNAYNEFVRDFVERHGECQATRDEAHERADWCKALGKSVVDLAKRSELSPDTIDWMVSAIPEIKEHEAYLVACAVAAALEEVK